MRSFKNKFQAAILRRAIGFLLFLFCVSACLRLEIPAQTKAVWARPFIKATLEQRKNPVEARKYISNELDLVKRAGLDGVFVEVLWDGYTIYPSIFFPQRPLSIAYGVARKDEAGQTETYDPLTIYIDEAEKRGIKIHAWLHVFHQWSTNLGPPEKAPIFSKFPELMVLDRSSSPLVRSEAEGENRDIFKVFMSPSHPTTRKLLRQAVTELCDKYPKLGGIQWDYIRYPLHWREAPYDYSADALAKFSKETSLDATKLSAKDAPKEWRVWQDWKTRQVNEVVAELGAIVRKKQPKWTISAAVFPGLEENLRVKMQDWKQWSDKGYVDLLMPMVYSRDYKRVEAWTKEFRELVDPKVKVAPAIFIPHFYDAKAETFDDRYIGLTAKFKLDGYGLFASQFLTEDFVSKLK
jgi:uncharacterized lipoprotein YddW (UPF0748 family)